MATRFNHALTPAMIALLRWYLQAPSTRRRRYRERPRPNKAQKRALISRGLVIGGEADKWEPEYITTEGRQLLKMVDKNPRAWMPKENAR